MTRKPHVYVDESEYLRVIREVGIFHLEDIASYLNVSSSTARRKLDGLVVQGKAVKYNPNVYGALSEVEQ